MDRTCAGIHNSAGRVEDAVARPDSAFMGAPVNLEFRLKPGVQ